MSSNRAPRKQGSLDCGVAIFVVIDVERAGVVAGAALAGDGATNDMSVAAVVLAAALTERKPLGRRESGSVPAAASCRTRGGAKPGVKGDGCMLGLEVCGRI